MTPSRAERSRDQDRPRDPELERLGGRLRSMRDYLGMSQQFVADGTGIPRTAISDIERGARRVDSLELKKFARLYRRPVAYFLAEEEDADPGEYVLAGLPRALATLTEGDRIELARYAEYLAFRRTGTGTDAPPAPAPDSGPASDPGAAR
ncbi:helix-turn-helix domain-containing protein [Yinghuangia sp. YIM S09857]|uniref:helix-turn-helix domain-containing protein n=1 Tax=Yinghuangia sp. YIM S09857 TaxID=3436929 RepID=UPI003F5374B3